MSGQEFVAVVTRKHEEHETDEKEGRQRAARRLSSILCLFIAGGVHWRMLNAALDVRCWTRSSRERHVPLCHSVALALFVETGVQNFRSQSPDRFHRLKITVRFKGA